MARLDSFTELECWKACQEVKIFVLEIVRKFPAQEKFDLIDNMRRAARSSTRNKSRYGTNNYQQTTNNKRTPYLPGIQVNPIQVLFSTPNPYSNVFANRLI